MYTNNEKIQISREKSPFSDEREEIIFAGRGNLLEGSNPRSTPPIDSILIVFHAFERAPSRKIELYELATSFYERVFASRSGCTSSNDRRGRALTRSKVDFTTTEEEEEETVSFGKSFFADGRTNGGEIWTWKIDFPRRWG